MPETVAAVLVRFLVAYPDVTTYLVMSSRLPFSSNKALTPRSAFA